jgi:hypothetical protein
MWRSALRWWRNWAWRRTAVFPRERRQAQRYPSSAQTQCQPIQAGAFSMPARVRNVSLTGVNLLLTQPVSPGTLLHITLAGPAQAPRRLLACVLHVSAQEVEETIVWSAGCSFVRDLEEEELRCLL